MHFFSEKLLDFYFCNLKRDFLEAPANSDRKSEGDAGEHPQHQQADRYPICVKRLFIYILSFVK